ncbi:LacI family transcriptional regulator [Glaciihabitans tibetensis]|uniref:LacI family transcriptional regulator n=1 Tax=Glaciihabitans tibetensis TaxID=1266600 RepID=A0A2T0V6Y8_9MICO|nr:LacI family DNA-binding transcriptional regulator [Glaciihabitans tibetensis]PRY65955.1 LacI family transcriptional regulator [Glaciihabitans tibetensis]
MNTDNSDASAAVDAGVLGLPRDGTAPAPRTANIFDVARLAGVSHQTVSRVVNDIPNVRPATRARVEDAIRQLRYRPSTAARALVTKRSRTIGLITTGRPDYGPSSTVLGFSDAARQARYTVSIASMVEATPGSMRSSVEQLLGQNVEAIVLIAGHRGALDAITAIELGVPLVAVESSGRAGFHSVCVDQFAAARAATDYLVQLGHRDILHVAGPDDSMDAAERVRGWRASLSEHGLVAREPLVSDWSPRSGYQIGQKLLENRQATAVFAGNDQVALGLLHAFTENGVRVPQDVSVLGFDDIPEAEHFTPPLTTVRQDFEELGRDVMATLIEILRDDDSATNHVRPSATLVVRGSTAPPHRP